MRVCVLVADVTKVKVLAILGLNKSVMIYSEVKDGHTISPAKLVMRKS